MDPLRHAAQRSPGSQAVVEGGAWSFADLDRNSDAVASGLLRSGVTPGDRVAVRMPPSAESVALFHAVRRVAAIFVALDPSASKPETRAALESLGGVRLVIDRVEQIREWIASEEGMADSPGAEARTPAPDDLGSLVLTSGSTGAPRAIGITHGNLTASAHAVIERLGLGASDRWATSLSLAHIGGLTVIHRAAVLGCVLVTRPRFEAPELARLIDAGEVTHASLVPVMLKRLMAERGDRPPPRSLRCLLVGGAATPPSTLEAALATGYPVALTYGLTEATSQVATATPDHVRAKPGSVGPPLRGLALRIAKGRETGPAGEILVRGPVVAREPVEGAVSGSPHVDEAGWLHTGDLGHIDADGDLWITGRASDRIVSGGVTVEPAEIEAVLELHSGIAEVAVFGRPDPEWGERVVALIVSEDPLRPPTLPEILDFTRGQLRSAKRPRELRVVPSLPRTERGKLDRRRIREM